jgi:hypothetical protein
MLFKKKKKTQQVISLGLSSTASGKGGAEAAPPSVRKDSAPRPASSPSASVPAGPAEIVLPEIIPEAAGDTPARPDVAPPADAAQPSPAATVSSGEDRDDATLETVSVTSGLPVEGAVDSVSASQCPFCLEYVRAEGGRCEVCGNLVETGRPTAAPPAGDQIPPDAAATILTDADADEEPVAVDGKVLNDTRAMTEKPVPSVLKETKLLLPARLHLFGRKNEAETDFTLTIGRTTIGREQSNSLPFPDDEFISRHHCEIVYKNYQYVVRDMGSANGTYVNDVKVRETVLRDGDLIQVGPLRFLFQDPVEKMKKDESRFAAEAGEGDDGDAHQN